ncbi:MAG: hypothetical protein KAY37_16485 [Phycisphaerae bacterium]|nr:hypothetical protein [Phycisphaerae bacterium]
MTDEHRRIVTTVVAVGLAAFGSWEATGQEWPPWMQVEPSCPTEEDVVTITIGGIWDHTCTPAYPWIELDGSRVDFYAHLDPDCFGFWWPTPWELSAPVGPVSAGTYDVYACCCYLWLACDVYPMTFIGAFTVYRTGDLDYDGDVDLDDFNTFAGCLAGPDNAYPPECDGADLNRDGDIDLADFATFQRGFTGSGC